jgi:hypothetical protein
MRLVVLLAALVAVGCSGGDGNDDADAAEGLREFLIAVSADDRAAAAERLSAKSKLPQIDPLRERVPGGTVIPSSDDYSVLREGDVTIVVTDLATAFGAYAASVVSEDGVWKVQFPSEALRLVEGPPAPRGAVGPDQRVGFAVYSRARDLSATLWIDREKHELAGAGGPEFTRYWATPELAPGVHTAVALARARGEAAAVAWTFTVGPPG